MPTRCNRGFFIADLIACSTCFGHHYAHHQELKSIIQWLLPVVFRAVVLCYCSAGQKDRNTGFESETTYSAHYIYKGKGNPVIGPGGPIGLVEV